MGERQLEVNKPNNRKSETRMEAILDQAVKAPDTPARKVRSAGVKLASIVIATLALAASAMAKIRETPEQVIARSQRDKDVVSIGADEWLGKKTLAVSKRDGAVVTHLFGADGREIALYLYAPLRLSPEDVAGIQREYPGSWQGTGTADGLFSWESDKGLHMAAKREGDHDWLWIFDGKRPTELGEVFAALKQEIAPKAIPVPPSQRRKRQFAAPSTPAPTPKIDFVPITPAPSNARAVASSPNDCLILATEALKRLKPTAHWARIAGFKQLKDGKEIGHAVVFYKATDLSNVFMYDKEGSLELPTQSHDLNKIINALNQLLSGTDVTIKSAKWVDSANDQNQFIADNNASATTEQTAEQIGIIIGVILMLAGRVFVVVISFLKGKPGFGGVGMVWPIFALIGAIRMAKPHSWWARKYYGTEKMTIALQRFMPLPQ
jgi:hypothetical protein